MIKSEQRACQNCKSDFRIEPEDFAFYEKMQVPSPTFCPECRLIRRLMFRNSRTLYKRKCALCQKPIITIFAPDKDVVVYCNPCWWGDGWDAADYGQPYDPSKNFFDQLRELQRKVPHMALIVDQPNMINSEYNNLAGALKNCYLSFNGDSSENCLYMDTFVGLKDCMEGILLYKSERCYENINCQKSYDLHFSQDCNNCRNVFFSKNCSGCNDCFGCANLRNKQYYFFNEPHSKEEYQAKIARYDLGSQKDVVRAQEEAHRVWNRHPVKYMHGRHNANVSGDYIYNSKNVHDSYDVVGTEDGKYCQWITMGTTKDSYDYTEWGNNAQRVYEALTVGENVDSVRLSVACWMTAQDIDYGMYLVGCEHMFGCVNMRKKQYCILNTRYPEKEFRALRRKIIEDLDRNPYRDVNERIFKYGEFFPYGLSPFDYNESTAQDFFPLSKDGALEKGFRWYEKKEGAHVKTKKASELPDHIQEISDAILKDVIECAGCGSPYRIVKPELKLLRLFRLPIPRYCFECRHRRRLSQMNPIRFFDRECAKCKAPFRTAYRSTSQPPVYCEQCYQAEVA